MVADTLGSADYILGTAELHESKTTPHDKPIYLQLLKKPQRPLYLDTRNSLLSSQEPANCPNPDPD